MANPSLNPFQQQALEAMKQQQDAYLEAVRSWKAASGAQAGFSTTTMPQMPTFDGVPDLPTPAEVAEANQLFLTRVFEEQQRFFTALNDILQRQP
jgi:hypothetical protein